MSTCSGKSVQKERAERQQDTAQKHARPPPQTHAYAHTHMGTQNKHKREPTHAHTRTHTHTHTHARTHTHCILAFFLPTLAVYRILKSLPTPQHRENAILRRRNYTVSMLQDLPGRFTRAYRYFRGQGGTHVTGFLSRTRIAAIDSQAVCRRVGVCVCVCVNLSVRLFFFLCVSEYSLTRINTELT